MAVYRCNQCGLIGEEKELPAGSKSNCKRCQAPVTLFDTVYFIEKLLERYQAVLRELDALKRQEDDKEEHEAGVSKPDAFSSVANEEMYNTALLATEQQHKPLQQWFAAKQIKTVFEYSAVDTTGFFDEAAQMIGDEYALLSNALEQVRYAYRKDWTWVNVELDKKSPQEQQHLKAILRQLYSYTFFARYVWQKEKNAVGLTLQSAVPVRRFLEGSWLEWWAFMQLLALCVKRGVQFSCARDMHLEFPNEERRELDVVFMVNGKTPVIVECKAGEFRVDLKKYAQLQKRLGLTKEQFIICNPDIDVDQATGLNAMHGITFVNLQTFGAHVAGVI